MEKCKETNVTLSLGLMMSKKGNALACLVADLGYKNLILTFDESIISETLKMSVYELYTIKNQFASTQDDTDNKKEN